MRLNKFQKRREAWELNVAFLVNSRGGNTRMVAGAIKKAVAATDATMMHLAAIPDAAEASVIDTEMSALEPADVVMVGFWCDKGTCSPAVATLLSKLSGKKVFLFGTCGFGASEEYYAQIIDRVSSNLPLDAEVLGWTMCQGKMGSAVRKRYETMLAEDPEDARAHMLLDNWIVAKSHPDKTDLENMAQAAVEALAKA